MLRRSGLAIRQRDVFARATPRRIRETRLLNHRPGLTAVAAGRKGEQTAVRQVDCLLTELFSGVQHLRKLAAMPTASGVDTLETGDVPGELCVAGYRRMNRDGEGSFSSIKQVHEAHNRTQTPQVNKTGHK